MQILTIDIATLVLTAPIHCAPKCTVYGGDIGSFYKIPYKHSILETNKI